jgi:Recombination endonuclease VII
MPRAEITPEQREAIGAKISASRMASVLTGNLGAKRCRLCKNVKSKEQFGADPRNRGGLQGRCRDCQNKVIAERHKANPGLILHFRRRRYGIRFEQMWDQQNGLCALCGLPMRLQGKHSESVCVDHDHACCSTIGRSCGKCVRGLIHASCNRMLGQAKDNPDLLQQGAEYLRRWENLK